MASITEKMGLNYDLNGTEADYFTKLNENTLKIDAFLPLCVIEQIALADLPLVPTDGEIYLVDSSTIYIRQQSTWYTFILPCGITFYDETEQNFYKYDGTNIFLDTGTDGVLDAVNVGGQVEVYRDKISGILNFKTLVAGAGITLTPNADDIEIEALASGFPAGTKLPFYQAVAPVGWTLDASINDRFIRISNSAGGTTSGSFSNLSHFHPHSHTHSAGTLTSQIAWNDPTVNTGRCYIRRRTIASWTPNTVSGGFSGIDPIDGTTPVTGSIVVGDTGAASITNTSTQTISHGSAQHAYADFIICTKD